MSRTHSRRRVAPAPMLTLPALIALAAAGCDSPPEGNLPPPVVASPDQMKSAIERTTAGAPVGAELEGPRRAPRKK